MGEDCFSAAVSPVLATVILTIFLSQKETKEIVPWSMITRPYYSGLCLESLFGNVFPLLRSRSSGSPLTHCLLFQGTLPTYSSRIAVTAVDNIIMVHQIDAKVVILYDVFMDSYTPISAPLPLLVRGLSSNSRQAAQTADHQSSAYGGTLYGEG